MVSPADMSDVKQQLYTTEQKYKRFKEQQFIFIRALERSRDHARDRTEPVSTLTQVQRYMNHHCKNATDRSIFSLFLEIISDLGDVLKRLEFSLSSQNSSSEALDTCKELLNPNSNISHQSAHYPHNEINRLSCDEAKNYYGGIVSVIPLALDLLTSCCRERAQPLTPPAIETLPQQTEAENTVMSAGLDKGTSNNSSRYKKGTGGWHAGKPAWKPPGNSRK